MKDKVLVFIPMYNCEKQITRVLNQIKGEITNYISEIIIVNNRSTDQSEQVVEDYIEYGENVIPMKLMRNRENYGLGGSHKIAFNYAIDNGFDYIIVLHGDDQGNINDFLPILQDEYLLKKYDCFLGGRFLKDSVLDGYSKFRTFGNHIFNIIFSIAIGKRIYDLGAGLNMYSVEMLKTRYYMKFPDNLTFNCYMLFALAAYKQKYYYAPITWREDDQVSNVKMTKQAWQTFKMAVGYFCRRAKYLQRDAREIQFTDYLSDMIREG